MREIAGVPESLIAEFSSRRAQALDHYDRLADEWRQIHGRTPTKAERATMLDQATVRSRHRKSGAPVDLHAQWRVAATVDDLAALAHTVPGADTEATPPVDCGRLPAGSDEIAGRVFAELHEQRSWWTRAHVTSEVARLIADPTPEAIEVETERLIEKCVPLEVDTDPAYADAHAAKYTSPTIRDAEQRVLNAADHDSATFTVETVRDPMLGDDQVAAVDEIAGGGGRIATVVGPAGAGKTTMLRSVAASYHHGERKVAVLTLSAVAARVVRDETGLDAHTIASWRVGQVDIPRRGLVIVDEASMAPTLVLDELVRVADIYRSKVALIGDYAQMGAPEAGGLLRDLAARPAAVELTAVRRFRNQWEADASLMLRFRQPSIASTYERQGRINEATNDTVFDRAAAAWWADTDAGNTALVAVDTADDAADVSTRCQRHLIVDGRLGTRVAHASDGCRIHIGDQIQTRRNTSDITTSDHQRVLNRDVWTVLEHHDDGSLTVAHTSRPARAVLPADYVASDVVLAYATTIAGAQGRTVDRGHTVVTPRTTSASLYVGMTRGRECNHAHVVTDSHDHTESELGDLTGQQAFAKAIVRDPEGQLSAHTVAQRWNATANERARARTLDRQRQHVVRWWDARYRSLPPRMQTALADHHPRIIDHLMTVGTDAERGHLINTAAGATDWRTSTATADFLNRLRQLDRSNAARTVPPSPAAVRRYER
jgi:hypothetical protein